MVFVAAGVLGLLSVAGVADWDGIVGRWWPIAFVGWAVAEMVAARRVTAFAAIIVVIGLGILADNLAWAGRGIIWSSLFLGVGGAILWGIRSRDRSAAGRRARSWCPSWCCPASPRPGGTPDQPAP
jgi:hypothetical protein